MKSYIYRGALYKIPNEMSEMIDNYVNKFVRPDSFLQAVICNDLVGAISHADDDNLEILTAYMLFFYNDAPGDCWGSKAKMEAWLEKESYSNL